MQETYERITRWWEGFLSDCKKRWYLFPIVVICAALENRIMDYVNSLLDKIPFAQWALILRNTEVFGRSVVALALLTGILLIHSYWETRPRRLDKAKPTPETAARGEGTRSLLTSKTLGEQFMSIGAESKITVSGAEHVAGILIEVTQNSDRDHALPCEIVLTDLKEIKHGDPCTVPELHKPDGSFKYGRVSLPLGTSHSDLFFNAPQRWWLMQGPTISYQWGKDKTPGSFTLPSGVWIAYFEVHAGDYVLNRQFTFTWSGSGVAEFV